MAKRKPKNEAEIKVLSVEVVNEQSPRDALMEFLNRVISNAKLLEPMLHEAAMRIAKHAEATGDATPAKHFYEGLPKSQRRKAIAAWWEAYTQIRLRDTEKNGVTVKLDRTKEWDLVNGNLNPFYNMDENQVGRPMGEVNIVTRLESQLKKQEETKALFDAATDDIARAKIVKPGVSIDNEIAKTKKALAAVIAALAA